MKKRSKSKFQRYFIIVGETLDDLEKNVNADLNKDMRRTPVGHPFVSGKGQWGQVVFGCEGPLYFR